MYDICTKKGRTSEKDPRNSTIFSMFSLVDLGERASTGIPSIYYAWENAFDLKPTLIDMHNPDRTEMFVPKMREGFASENHIKKPLVAVNEVSPSVKDENVAVNPKNVAVNPENVAVNPENMAVNPENMAVNPENMAVKKVSKENRKSQILKLLTREKQLSSSEISNAIGIKITLTKKYLSELVAENRIQTTGTFRNRTYHLINN